MLKLRSTNDSDVILELLRHFKAKQGSAKARLICETAEDAMRATRSYTANERPTFAQGDKLVLTRIRKIVKSQHVKSGFLFGFISSYLAGRLIDKIIDLVVRWVLQSHSE